MRVASPLLDAIGAPYARNRGAWAANTAYIVGDLVTYAGATYVATANSNGATFVAASFAVLPAVDSTALHYLGPWAGQPVKVNDVVKYQGSLYRCISPLSVASGVIGTSTAASPAGGYVSYNVPLPAGCAIGDLAVLLIQTVFNYGPTGPAGWTSMAHGGNFAGVSGYSTSQTANLYSRTLTSTDIANGYVNANTGSAGSASALVVARGMALDATRANSATGLTTPAITPAGPGAVLLFAGDGGAPHRLPTGAQGGAYADNTGAQPCEVSVGWATYSSGTFAGVTFSGGASVVAYAGALPLTATGAFPAAAFERLDAQVPAGGTAGQALVKSSSADYDYTWTAAVDATATHFKGEYQGNANYLPGDIVTYMNAGWIATRLMDGSTTNPRYPPSSNFFDNFQPSTRTTVGADWAPSGGGVWSVSGGQLMFTAAGGSGTYVVGGAYDACLTSPSSSWTTVGIRTVRWDVTLPALISGRAMVLAWDGTNGLALRYDGSTAVQFRLLTVGGNTTSATTFTLPSAPVGTYSTWAATWDPATGIATVVYNGATVFSGVVSLAGITAAQLNGPQVGPGCATGDAQVQVGYFQVSAGWSKLGSDASGDNNKSTAKRLVPGGGSTGQALVKVSGNDGDAGWATPLGARASASVTTASLAAGAKAAITIGLGLGFTAYSIQTSRPARVQLYQTAAAMAADASRAVGTDPAASAGVILDYVTTDTSAHGLNPLVLGANLEAAPTAAISMRVTNNDTATGTVTVTLVAVRTE